MRERIDLLWSDRDPLAAEFGQERIGVGRIGKAEPDEFGRWIAAQLDARHVWHRVCVAELVHAHDPRDETAFRNPDRD